MAGWYKVRIKKLILTKLIGLRISAAAFRHQKHAPDVRLRLVWKSLTEDVVFQWLLRHLPASNPHLSLNNRLMDKVLRRNPDLSEAVVFHVPPELRQALDGQQASLFLHVHEGFVSLGLLFAQRGKEHLRVGAGRERYLSKLSAMGLETSLVHFVKRDGASLLAVRDGIRRGLHVCSAVDFTADGREKGFISPALFDFAARFGVPMIFVKSSVTRAGEVRLDCLLPQELFDGQSAAEAFIDFYNATEPFRAELEVRDYGL